MAKKLINSGISVLIRTVLLLAAGLVIWLFLKDSKTSYQDVLFYVGAVPVACFSIGMFGDVFGRGASSYQLSRSVSEKSPNQRAQQDVTDSASKTASGIIWIVSGLLVWLFSYFL